MFRPPPDGEWNLIDISGRVFIWFLMSMLVVWLVRALVRTFRANPLHGTGHVMFGVLYVLFGIVVRPQPLAGPFPPTLGIILFQFIMGLLTLRVVTALFSASAWRRSAAGDEP
jgi:hypothetical protein